MDLQQRFEEAEADRSRLEHELASVQDRLEKTRQDNQQVTKKNVIFFHLETNVIFFSI